MNNPGDPALAKFSGLGIGILLGGILAPIAFPSIPGAAATPGCFLTGALGYLIVSGFVFFETRRRDLELFMPRRQSAAKRDFRIRSRSK